MQSALLKSDIDIRSGASAPSQAGCQPEPMLHSPLGRIGSLEVRLARDEEEIAAAQRLRFRVFYEELGAGKDEAKLPDQRDMDRFDAVCDHLLVVDTAVVGSLHKRIVGTYRLLRQDRAAGAGGFYSSAEFELDDLIRRHSDRNFLELGRSCVIVEYRTKRTVELLWQGIWAYCRQHGIDVMTGCASFAGITPAAHAEPLSFLHHFCLAEGEWHVRAVSARHESMDLMPAEAIGERSALAAMPPLLKGYLRLGARFGEGCVIDRDFGTIDVLVILPVETISQRYINYYGADAQRFAG